MDGFSDAVSITAVSTNLQQPLGCCLFCLPEQGR